MSTAFGFSALVDAAGVTASGRSIGAHIAAKLESFSSDERTLTDELCDMLCIWLDSCAPSAPVFTLNIKKTTVKQEQKNGADLRLIVRSAQGVKDCLLQAKVLDPSTGKLRCATPAGYASLKKQLKKARGASGSLAFLLVYVPSQFLDGKSHRFASWEQGFCAACGPQHSSAYGATIIPVDDLLDASGNWIDPVNKVPHAGGVFTNGVMFSKFLLELLVCLRGSWAPRENEYRALDLNPLRHAVTLDVAISSDAAMSEIRESALIAMSSDT